MTVRASGGVVVRQGATGPEVLIVHRPRYDDWSLPKGKREPGETDEQCAIREVDEETGVRCSLGPELLPQKYVDRKGRSKVVRYWLMQPMHERTFDPNDEIDEVRWVALTDAGDALTYPGDRDQLANVSPAFTLRSPDAG
ncbi:MAG TPA: NUDIX hydrolase [Acidimicrobiales bacterium]|nr:NUDIX hydrolase [Acidimicrobiales bacterium]